MRYLRTLALITFACSVACGGKKGDDKQPVTDGLSGLHASADTVLDELGTIETKKDVTCWVSFRQLDWFIAEKSYSEFATLAKISAVKGLVRATWEKASTLAKGGAVSDADVKAAVKLPDIKLSGQVQQNLGTFANDIGLKNFTDYQKTAEHARMVLAVIQDEMYSTGGTPTLKPLDPAGVRALTDATTTLSLIMLKESGKAADEAKSPIIEGPHVQTAYKAMLGQLALNNTPHPLQPLSPALIDEHLKPITKKLIDNKVEALLAFNKGARNVTQDLNKVTRIPLTDDGLAVMMRDAQSFVHFLAAGFEPMQADNYLSDGSFAKTKMARKSYIDETWAQNVVMQLFPHHMHSNGDIDVKFEVNPGPVSDKPLKGFAIKLLDHEMNGVRDSAVHWIALQNVFKERAFAMDPFAAEYVSEVVSMMVTLWIRRGETIANDLGKKQIDADVANRIRSRAYVMVPPAEMQFAAWTDERKKQKQAVIASVPAALFKDTSKTAGLPTKFAKWNVDLDSIQAHVEPDLKGQPGHVEPNKDLKNQPGHVGPDKDLKNQPGHVGPDKDLKNQPGHVAPDKDLKGQPGHVAPDKDLKNQPGHVAPDKDLKKQPGHVAPDKDLKGQPGHVAPDKDLKGQPGHVAPDKDLKGQPGHVAPDKDLKKQPGHVAPDKDLKGQPGHVAPDKDLKGQPGHVAPDKDLKKQPGHVAPDKDLKGQPGHVAPDKDLKKQPGHVEPDKDLKKQPGHVQPDTKGMPGHVEPDTKGMPGHVEPPKLVIELTTDNKIVIGGKTMTDAELDNLLRAALTRDKNVLVVISPAKGAQNGKVVSLLERIKKAGITKISIADPAMRNIPGHVEPDTKNMPGHVEPDTKNLPGHVEPPKFIIELTADGKTMVDGKAMTDNTLEYALRGAFATDKTVLVVIITAKGAQTAKLAALLDRIKKLGIAKISISDPAMRNIPGHVEPETKDMPGHVEPSTSVGGFNLQTIMGGGIAVGDLNGDEYPDLYLTGEELGRLYLNKGKGGPATFTDATAAWGLPEIKDGHGTLFFDLEGDGDLDLLVLRSEHPSAVFRNDKGKFTDVHAELGLVTHRGGHVAHIWDYDRDGDLDIYIGYYGAHDSNMSPGTARSVPSLDGRNGSPNQLWRNDGGKFVEVAKQAKVDDIGWCLAVASADYDADGDLDLFLANDFGADVFYKNNGDGTFGDITEATGTGDRGSGMNAEFGDVNGDGKWDIYVTNIDMFSKNIKVIYPRDETTINIDDKLTKAFQYIAGNKLYVSTKEGGFRAEENLRMEPMDRGWGWDASFFDYENDGDDDLYVTNGWINGSYAGNQKNQMYLNHDGYLYLAPPSSPEAFPGNTRSAAAVDLDLDGDIDLVSNQFRQPPRVLINQQASKNSFVQLRLSSTKGKNPRAIGAQVMITANGKPLIRQVTGGRGYISQGDTLVTAGIKDAKTVDVTIRWPDGSESKHPGLAANKRHAIAQP